jgi:hypothetical protein
MLWETMPSPTYFLSYIILKQRFIFSLIIQPYCKSANIFLLVTTIQIFHLWNSASTIGEKSAVYYICLKVWPVTRVSTQIYFYSSVALTYRSYAATKVEIFHLNVQCQQKYVSAHLEYRNYCNLQYMPSGIRSCHFIPHIRKPEWKYN